MNFFNNFKNVFKGDIVKTPEQRKEQTEKYLKSLNIPFIDHLPVVKGEKEVKIRTAQEIAERILILVYFCFVNDYPNERNRVIEYLKSNFLWEKVSPKEKLLFQKGDNTDLDRANISWRVESVWLLLWAINLVDKLGLPLEPVEISEIESRLPKFLGDPSEFINSAVVRSVTEILDQEDLYFRLRWATIEASINKQPMPANLNYDVVLERIVAIRWVTSYNEDWDEINSGA